MRLPSGRHLFYAQAQIEERGAISYLGVNPYNKSLAASISPKGKLVENAVQALCADLLHAALVRCEDRGLDVVLDVHDEIICEVSPDRSVDELVEAMIEGEPWSEGFPLAAVGFETERYRKE